MIENHELDNLMTNGEELEKLKSSRTTEQVLEILKKYNYTEDKEVFERELLEILQSITLDDENMHNISGGRLMKTKTLSMMLGSLMALNGAGFMSAGAVTENQSLLNNVDTKTVAQIGLGAAVVGSLWGLKEIVTSRRDNKTFKLNSIQQRIYSDTKKLSEMILKYVEDYITKNSEMPAIDLDINDPEHRKILDLIRDIRTAWITMYEKDQQNKLNDQEKEKVIGNSIGQLYSAPSDSKIFVYIFPVEINTHALSNLFGYLPVEKSYMSAGC